MKNTFGQNVTVTLFGESHGPYIGAVLDGMAPGIPVDESFIKKQMELRKSISSLSTARKEADTVQIISGVKNGYTEGTPITFLIENTNTKSCDYDSLQTVARPGHADYTGFMKYHGFSDSSGGGHFSGRLTAPLVAAGAVAITALSMKNIRIATHIASCGGVNDRKFDNLDADMTYLNQSSFAVLDEDAAKQMQERIETAKKDGDSVGGILETVITGLPVGVGEPWFDTVEGLLSHALFSIPACKGLEFGDGFALANKKGSAANDIFAINDGKIITETNHCGGILGGITNGMPVFFRSAFKPTPSIYKVQKTVDFAKMENTDLQIHGRHDPAIVHRARVVVDSMAAITLLDLLSMRYGTEFFAGGDPT